MKFKEASNSAQNQQSTSQQKLKKDQHSNIKHESTKDNSGFTNVPSFLLKTYDIVNDPSCDNIICWNESGEGFIVKQPNEFAERILPRYFKHNNFSSFVRQLNIHLLIDIKRKNAIPQAEKSMINSQKMRGGFNDQSMDPGRRVADFDDMQDYYQRPAISGPPEMMQIQNYPQSTGGQSISSIFEGAEGALQILQKLDQRYSAIEDKIKNLEKQNQEYAQANHNLWQELHKSRDREQNLEKLFILAFSCFAQASGFNFFGQPRELLNQQFMNGNNQVPSTVNSSATKSSNSGGVSGLNPSQNNEQIVVRNEQNDVLSLIKKLINQPGLINTIISMAQGFKNQGQPFDFSGAQGNAFEASDLLSHSGGGSNPNLGTVGGSGSGGNLGSQLLSQQFFEQFSKGLQSGSGNGNIDLKNVQQFINSLDNENLQSPNLGPTTSLERPTNRGPNNHHHSSMNNQGSSMNQQQHHLMGHNQRNGFTSHSQSGFNRYYPPQITNNQSNMSPPIMSPNPYALDDFDKSSYRGFYRTLSENSFDLGGNNINNAGGHNNQSIHHHNLGGNMLNHNQNHPHQLNQHHQRLSRANSFGAGSIAQSDDNTLIYIAKEQAPSEVDSDAQRKKLKQDLSRAFDQYLNTKNETQSHYASNHNVEFETISNNSNNNNQASQQSRLGKRTSRDNEGAGNSGIMRDGDNQSIKTDSIQEGGNEVIVNGQPVKRQRGDQQL